MAENKLQESLRGLEVALDYLQSAVRTFKDCGPEDRLSDRIMAVGILSDARLLVTEAEELYEAVTKKKWPT